MVGHFPLLKMDVRVLDRAPQRRMIGVEPATAKFIHCLTIHQLRQFPVFQYFDLLHFMRSPEPVKKVQKRHPALDS